MVVLYSWIKKELIYLKDSFFEIIKAFVIVILASSGFGCALFLRYQGFNGTIITFTSLVVEFVSLILCYFMFRGYMKSEEELMRIFNKRDLWVSSSVISGTLGVVIAILLYASSSFPAEFNASS